MIHKTIQNKYSYVLPIVAVIGMMLITSCDSSTGTEDPEPEIEANTVENLDANEKLTLFSLRTGEIVDHADSASTNWDIGFNNSGILVNSGVSGPGSGGAVVLDVAFNEVTIAPSDGYSVDGAETLAIPTGSDNGWYHYTGSTGNPAHAIIPLPDKTIVVRTADGNHYAKLQLISYYKDNPDLSSEEYLNNREAYPSRHYTFNYVIQLEEGLRELE